MKVSLDSVEMSDEQRVQLANIIDGKVSKRKATRIEAKDFIWSYGKTWAATLEDMTNGEEPTEGGDAANDEDDDDLIGEPDLDGLL